MFNPEEITYSFVSPQQWVSIMGRIMEIDMPFWEGTGLEGDAEHYTNMFAHPRSITYVAEHEGNIVGFVNCLPAEEITDWFRQDNESFSDYYGEIGPNSSYVHGITVVEPYQRRGIGSNLFSLALNESRHRGYDTLSGYFSHATSKSILDRFHPRVSKTCNWLGEGKPFELGVIDLDMSHSNGVQTSEALVPYK
ncbi:MAG: GNAT family N-acetyltransferase [Candidatus Aenigmatarchaeota archaeon]